MDASNREYIVSPVLDFMLLGGGSLILFPLVMYIWPVEYIHTYKLGPVFAALAVFLSYTLNFPHFIYSYQLIYQDFFKKAGGTIDKSLQIPYIWAGVVVPAAMIILFASCFLNHDLRLFGFVANVGLLISGWHYAKQAFGVLIVTSIYQRIFYTPWERRVLIWNANVLWCYVWVMFNTGMHHRRIWHMNLYTLGFPQEIQKMLFYLVCLGILCLIFIFMRKYIRESVFPPITGLVGYLTTLYFWLVLLRYWPSNTQIHPIVLLVPPMHALQYITIVFKMKQNEVVHNKLTRTSLAVFIVTGVVLAILSFVAIPRLLDKTFIPQGHLYTSILFVTLFAVFINIHHFFIDNVIWRKESSEVKDYLYEFH